MNVQGRTVARRRSSRPFWRSRTLRYGVALFASIAGVLLFLLASASSNTPLFERHYPLLLALNVTAAAGLLLIVLILVVRLVRRYRAGQFGTRMMARFAVSFALMGLVPGALIYLVSVQFLSKSIESWFDVRVDSALESGLAIGRTTLDAMVADLNSRARTVAFGVSDVAESQQGQVLNRLRQQIGAQDALLFTANGRVLAEAVAGSDSNAIAPVLPPPNVMRQLRIARGYAAIESVLPDSRDPSADDGRSKPSSAGTSTATDARLADEGRGLRIRVVVPVPAQAFLLRPEAVYVQLMQDVSPVLSANAEAVQNGMRDYQELSLSRTGLRKIYTVTLTLTLLLSICAAMAVAFLLASWLTAPLLLLAEGTKAVAGGDYSPMREIETNDELGTLMQSFNAMVRQLGDARESVEKNRAALVAANTYLESILSNLSAGVLVFDDGFRLVTANVGAAKILSTPLVARLGHRLADPSSTSVGRGEASLRALGKAIEASFADPATVDTDWQRQIELDIREEGEPLVVLARGSRCPVGSGADRRDGYLVVFDDMTDGRVGRGRPPPRARDQEPADADPALRRAIADEARRPCRARGSRGARAWCQDDRQPGLGDEADGRRLPRLCEGPSGDLESARSECARRRGDDALRRACRRRSRRKTACGRFPHRGEADRSARRRPAVDPR
jgi:nitrogen fixation/metabolism regulation signal transduction histidine kinase